MSTQISGLSDLQAQMSKQDRKALKAQKKAERRRQREETTVLPEHDEFMDEPTAVPPTAPVEEAVNVSPTFTSPAEELEYALQHHDWHFDYSDDGRVWQAGKEQQDRIHDLCKAVEPAVAVALYEQYAPEGYRCPVSIPAPVAVEPVVVEPAPVAVAPAVIEPAPVVPVAPAVVEPVVLTTEFGTVSGNDKPTLLSRAVCLVLRLHGRVQKTVDNHIDTFAWAVIVFGACLLGYALYAGVIGVSATLIGWGLMLGTVYQCKQAIMFATTKALRVQAARNVLLMAVVLAGLLFTAGIAWQTFITGLVTVLVADKLLKQ